MKCKHLGSVTIYETGTESISWELQDGKIVDSSRGGGDIQLIIIARCNDCEYEKSYNRNAKSLPEWVSIALDRIFHHGSEDLYEQERLCQDALREQTERIGIVANHFLSEEEIERFNAEYAYVEAQLKSNRAEEE